MPGPENSASESLTTSGASYHGVREMLLLGLMAASFDAEIILTNNVVPITCRHFTDSAFLISAIIACKRLFGSLIQPWASWKSDFVRSRFGRRRPFLLIGLPCAALALLALGLMPVLIPSDAARHTLLALAALFLINSVLQVAVDLNWGVLEPLYADSFRQEQLGRASSIRQVASKLLTLCMVTFVIGWADYNELYPYLFGAGVFTAALLLAKFGIKERVVEMPQSKSRYSLWNHLGIILASRDLIKLAIVCTANLALPAALSLLTPLYVTETLGLPMSALGRVQILGVVLSVLLAFPLGWLIDAIGAKWVMAAGFALFAVASAALAFWTHDYLGLFVSMTLFGVAQTVALIPMTALVFQYCAPHERGQIFGVIQFVRAFSTFLLSISLGSLVQLASSYDPTPFRSQDIKEISTFVAQLQGPSNQAARFVRDNLSPESKSLLAVPAGNSNQLRDALTSDLNRIMHGPCIYTPDRFAAVPLSRQSRRLLAESPARGDRLIVLNRALLQDSFPEELSRKVDYRLPYYVCIGLSILAMVTALTTRRGKFSRTMADDAVPG